MALAHDLVGSGPALVLVHGITESRVGFAPLIDDLATDHTVLAVDLPGHGESPKGEHHDVFSLANAAADTVRALGIEDPLLIGHSLGGTIVTLMAGTAGVAARGVVLIDQPLALGEFAAQLRPIEDQLRGTDAQFEAAVTGLLDGMAGVLSGAELERVRSQRRPDQQVVLEIWQAVLDADDPAQLDQLTQGLLATVTVPFLSLHGETTGSYRDWLLAALPHAEIEEWPGVGHYPHLVHPDRFLQRLREFEASLS